VVSAVDPHGRILGCFNRSKNHDVKYSFYEELDRVFDKFSKYHMKILLGGFIAKSRQGGHF
jgi:hypothetical protein